MVCCRSSGVYINYGVWPGLLIQLNNQPTSKDVGLFPFFYFYTVRYYTDEQSTKEGVVMTSVNEDKEFSKTHPARFREYISVNPSDPLVAFLTNPVNKLTEEFVNRMGLYYLRDGVVELKKTVGMKVTKQALRTFKYAKDGKSRKHRSGTARELFLCDYVSYFMLSKLLKELK